MKRLSAANARYVLLGLWALFFALNLAVIFYLHYNGRMEADNFKLALSKLSSLYSTYLGVMVAYIFAQQPGSAGDDKGAGGPFVVAVVCSLIWNLPITMPVFQVLREQTAIEDAVALVGDLGAWLSWIVAPGIGYYFAKS